jgi:putative flippase GtrA
VSRTLFSQFGRFLLVGAVGFAIDGGLLDLLVCKGLDPYVARAISFPPAVTVTWYLNRIWAFGVRDSGARRQYLRYIAVQIVGAVSNYAVYGVVLLGIPHTPTGVLGAFAAGSAAGLVVNFVGARTLVFIGGHSSGALVE